MAAVQGNGGVHPTPAAAPAADPAGDGNVAAMGVEQPQPSNSAGGGRAHGRSPHKRGQLRDKKDQVQARVDARAQKLQRQVRSVISRKPSDPRKWLHGTLFITVHQAELLPGDPSVVPCVPFFINRAISGIPALCGGQVRPPYPYVAVMLGGTRAAYTSTAPRSQNPVWEESFRLEVAGPTDEVKFNVKDFDSFGAPHLGSASISAEQLRRNPRFEGWMQLRHRSGRKANWGKARLRVSVVYTPVTKSELEGGAGTWDVPNVYFPPRRDCRVTLYADAHQPEDGSCPSIPLAEGLDPFVERGAWNDLYAAIMGAQKIIYITGWAVWTQLLLLRDPNQTAPTGASPPLGEILKQKADAGVRVLVLQWDDRTSIDSSFLPIKTAGLLGTHDEETRKYFEGTNVTCVLALRLGVQEKNFILRNEYETAFTHHQKSVIVDVPYSPDGVATNGAGSQRRLMAFVGGIDVTDGRYDTRQHSLFRTLNTVHATDFYQNCVPGILQDCGGPREPWHDIHCRLEGAVVWDVLHNFQARWQKQAGEHADRLLNLTAEPGLQGPPPPPAPASPMGIAPPTALPLPGLSQREAWSVQLFRSIDSESVADFPVKNAEAVAQNLQTLRGRTVDHSIHNAYIHAIRRAQRFIYIENQYFLGSSHLWSGPFRNVADHLIPAEIALKVAEKIRGGEPFAAYIVIPMYPEGLPDSASVQEVLHWQGETIAMMYGIVAQALKAAGRGHVHPREYLNFFCLGNREAPRPNDWVPAQKPKPGSAQELVQQTRRFMVYLHAKMMIVDDEFIIVGSANINQRSMDGTRDTEIAMGAHQPHLGNRGQVHGLRMSLWLEHTNQLEALFQHPEKRECVLRLNQLAEANWDAYTSAKVQDLPGHLLTYPVAVSAAGVVSHLEGWRYFPDTKADVLGKVAFAYLSVLRRKTHYIMTT